MKKKGLKEGKSLKHSIMDEMQDGIRETTRLYDNPLSGIGSVFKSKLLTEESERGEQLKPME